MNPEKLWPRFARFPAIRNRSKESTSEIDLGIENAACGRKAPERRFLLWMGMATIEVIRAKPGDKAEVSVLLQEYYEAASVLSRGETDDSEYWIAYCNGNPAGCIALRHLSQPANAGEIKRLFVRPTYRGNGIAGQLLRELEQFASQQSMSWLYLDTADEMAQAQRLYSRFGFQVCERYNDNPQATIFMRKSLARLTLREFKTGDETAFCDLNEAWIEKYFKLEEKDKLTLRQPEKYILAKGGAIFMALRNGVAVGCCALIPMQNETFELSKMGVAESERGRGIGRQLLEYVVAEARARGMRRLYLETNHRLVNAIHLYHSVGFSHVPPERVTPSPYERADVYMEMELSTS